MLFNTSTLAVILDNLLWLIQPSLSSYTINYSLLFIGDILGARSFSCAIIFLILDTFYEASGTQGVLVRNWWVFLEFLDTRGGQTRLGAYTRKQRCCARSNLFWFQCSCDPSIKNRMLTLFAEIKSFSREFFFCISFNAMSLTV